MIVAADSTEWNKEAGFRPAERCTCSKKREQGATPLWKKTVLAAVAACIAVPAYANTNVSNVRKQLIGGHKQETPWTAGYMKGRGRPGATGPFVNNQQFSQITRRMGAVRV
jgi:hypothetical protein